MVVEQRDAGAVEASDQRLTPRERIRRRAEFQRVYKGGVRLQGRFLTLLIHHNSLGFSRLGIVATRRLGGAVRRNKAKRRVRELFRRNKPARGVDVVVIARSELVDAVFSRLEADYRSALYRYRHP